jgi:hypothetical protein
MNEVRVEVDVAALEAAEFAKAHRRDGGLAEVLAEGVVALPERRAGPSRPAEDTRPT